MFKWLKDKFSKDNKEKIEKSSELENNNYNEESLVDIEKSEKTVKKNYEENSDKVESVESFIAKKTSSDTNIDIIEKNENNILSENKIDKETNVNEESKNERKEDDANLSKDKMDNEANINNGNIVEEKGDDANLSKDKIDNEANTNKENIVEEKNSEKKLSIFQKLKQGLNKTRNEMGVKLNTLLGSYVKIEDEMLDDIEDILISADVGMNTTIKIVDNLRETIIENKINDPKMVMPLLKEEAKKLMETNMSSDLGKTSPTIILVVGVNGVGKTTTIGKLSSRFRNENKKVLIAAADTFRAAAIDQLKAWGNRAEVEVISHSEGADPAAVIFDGISAAKSRKADILICDTAGRLHNKANLMKELEKINRIINREFPEANRETLLVLDATTGQNAINQAKTFKEVSDLTGIVLTKLDGSAKGGVVIALQNELQIPIKLVGVGEGIEDLQDFDRDSFIDAIFD